MRGTRVVLVMLSVAALTVALVHAQNAPPAPPQPRPGMIQMPRIGSLAGSTIGIRLADVTADQVKSLKLSKAEGAIVEAVNPNSPASTAGLREKDVIVEFDGERVRSAQHLSRLVSETPVGREVSLTVMREGKKSELRIKPEEGSWFNPQFSGIDREQMERYAEQMRQAGRDLRQSLPDVQARLFNRGRLGASIQTLTPELAEYFGVKSGVLVASVQKDSAAARAGLKAGDVITAIDGHSVASTSDLMGAMPNGNSTRDVTLTVTREKKELTLKATLEPARTRTQTRRGTPA